MTAGHYALWLHFVIYVTDVACPACDSGVSSLHAQLLRHPFHALQRQVALSSLHAAHVGAVDAQYLGEGFLTETSLHTVGAKVSVYRLLEIAYSHKA